MSVPRRFPFACQAAAWLGSAAVLGAADTGPMLDLQPLPDQEWLLQWSAPAGVAYRIEVSTNFTVWEPLWTLISTGMNVRADSATPFRDLRFYRARSLDNPVVVTGDHLGAGADEILLHPVNHATLVMGWGNKMIYVDPVGGATPFTGLPRADVILVCHNHGDHFNAATVDVVRATGAVIIAPQAVYNAMGSAQRSLTTVLANGAQTTVLGATVQAVPAYNLTSNYHPKGVGNGYVLTLNGKRIYVSGDTEDIPEMRALTGIDVAVICMNQPFTMTVQQAASAVRAFQPLVVYPYHYRNQDLSFSDRAAFKQLVGRDLGIEVRLRDWY